MDGVNGTACQRPTSTSLQLPESSHPPPALTVSGEVGSIMCDGEGEACIWVAAAIEGLCVWGIDEPSDDAGEGVVTTVDADGTAALLQPKTTTMTVTMAATDRVIG